MSAKEPEWFVSSSKWLEQRKHVSSSSTKSTQSAEPVSTMAQAETTKSKELCSNSLPNSTVSTREETSKSCLPRIDLPHLTLLFSVRDELTEKSSLVFLTSKAELTS